MLKMKKWALAPVQLKTAKCWGASGVSPVPHVLEQPSQNKLQPCVPNSDIINAIY
jgi:hypothetical protein